MTIPPRSLRAADARAAKLEIGAAPPARAFTFAVVKRLAAILLPLGFGLGDFLQTAKSAFVAAAADQIRAGGDRVSTSRIAAITGLSRADVANIRLNRTSSKLGSGQQRTARVMHGWFTDANFVDLTGRAMPLEIEGTISFAELVRKFSGDVPPRAMLRELLVAGMVELNSDGRVAPIRRHYKTTAASAFDLQSLSADLQVLLASATENVTAGSSSLRRITVNFHGRITAAVRRNVALRTERFLDAMSEYLHTASERTRRTSDDDTQASPFHVLLAHCEMAEEEAASESRPN